ncbi:leucyl aminopeptidase [Pseudooceanicola nanhaiensis]|uniref:leucyl aminopeptidase n=1 Tax=Pseudooceanicola nanhaiensis TaxID=375761 RepID=UPI001CD1F76E|nr:leucyl aminopeptidase [Pseudooceanicola nanhaiensis]MCA0921290.1 leucyl aminopeptidase [Pseudooceanicola nanhaiensis]
MATQLEMVKVFTKQLELCKVKPHETVIVLTEGDIRADYGEAFLLAAREMGANSFLINVPLRETRVMKSMVGRTAIAGNLPVIDTLKKADIVIDLMGMLFSHEQNEICATGTRMLFVREPFDILAQNMPSPELRARVEYGEKLLGAAKTMHITSDNGTDVTYELGQYRVMTQYGYTDEPGRWDHMGTGQVLSQGVDGKVNGKVVIAPGDAIVAFKRHVERPVELTIRDGYVTSIDGEGIDAAMMKDFMDSYNDPRAYAISHIGWGLLPSAKWYSNIITKTRDAEIGVNMLSWHGNVLFSLGPNTELGGNNDTACHLDIPLRRHTLKLDGQTIVENGKMMIPEMAA